MVLSLPAPPAAFFKQLLLHDCCSWGCLPQAKQSRDLEQGSVPAPEVGWLCLPSGTVDGEIYGPVLSRLGLTNHCAGPSCLLVNINENKNNNRFSGHHPAA